VPKEICCNFLIEIGFNNFVSEYVIDINTHIIIK
jgi:hypothetical protein